MNRKKLSGAQNRALAYKRAKDCEKNKQTLQELSWFCKATNQNTDLKSVELNKSEQTMESSYYDDVDLHSLGSVENETDDSFNNELKPKENKALWSLILKQREKEELIKKGPSTLPDDFPRDASNNRAFPKEVLFIALPNGEKVQRNYLIWSPSSNSLLCFPCSLFGCENSGSYGDRSLLLRWNGVIKNDWRKLSDCII
ncbi:zinc finger MYM-type protein 5-like [Hydra vulgaris]|uniref:zinc finger MYM-type protein 5-like n=1 Tax=Hydra vulgaris TaxID=6087 RepID=UPI001F5ED914|nr:zinc finger MYM-type protein 5-like [Hydra vulgaris]